MGKVDIATKQYMSHRDIIADAFNFYIYPAKISDDEFDKFQTDLGAIQICWG